MTKLNDFAMSVLRERCFIKNEKGEPVENPEQMFRRVAKCVSMAEKPQNRAKWEEEFYKIMTSLDFLPGSPTLFNAGRKIQMLSSCFVVPIEDSMDGIYGRLTEIASIQKMGGGTGMSFSKIRPKGDVVSTTGGVASGPVAFLSAFNGVTDSVKQGGVRRGANMGILKVDHPDIMDFITCKDKEGVLSTFNLSVALTDKFMESVLSDGVFQLINPRNKKVSASVNARSLFNMIVEQMWKNGEPGVVFIDTINKKHTIRAEIESTNPCITGEALVPTNRGLIPLKEVRSTDTTPQGDVLEFYERGEKDVITIKTRCGYTLTCTPEHKIRSWDTWIEAQHSKGKIIDLQPNGIWSAEGTEDDFERGYLDGLIWGDGWVSSRVGFVQAERELSDIVAKLLFKRFGTEVNAREYKNANGKPKYQVTTGKKGVMNYYKMLSLEKVSIESKSYQQGFMSGWYACDGHIERSSNMGIALTCIEESEARFLQLMLLNFGIKTHLYKVKRTGHVSDKKYKFSEPNKPSWRVQLARGFRRLFIDIFSWRDDIEEAELWKGTEYFGGLSDEVVSVESAGRQLVYDLNISSTHSFTASGFHVHNCGEQPLLPYESCNLGSVNLSNMVVKGVFDDEKLTATIQTAVRFLDDVIDVNQYPLERIKGATLANRKIGLGIMGWHDMLIKMGIPYDSEQAIEYIHEVMEIINEAASETSRELAEEKGVFPNVKCSIYDTHSHPPRNAERITIAPTGTISSIANISSGIEPHYALAYKRRVLDSEFNITVETLEETLKQYDITWDEIRKANGTLKGLGVPPEIKRLYKTALEISPLWHLKHQQTFQKYVDAAVSKTINLPNKTTKEEIASIILEAWKNSCKGLTMYRDGSRDEQVLSTGVRRQNLPVKRPDVIEARSIKVPTGCGSMYVTVGLYEGQVYEVLTAMGKAGGCANAMVEGICRLISISLRKGLPVEDIIEQLEGIRCPHPSNVAKGKPTLSCADAIVRAIITQMSSSVRKDHVIDSPCPSCGERIIFIEGCERCSVCTWARC